MSNKLEITTNGNKVTGLDHESAIQGLELSIGIIDRLRDDNSHNIVLQQTCDVLKANIKDQQLIIERLK